MIATNELDRINSLVSTGSSTTQIWRRVWLEKVVPYFLVCYETKQHFQTKWNLQTAIISQTSDLLSLCEVFRLQQNKYRSVQLVLIAPPWMAKSAGWGVHQISEVWRIEIDDQSLDGILYISDSGKRFVDLPPELLDLVPNVQELIFKKSN